MSLNYVTTQIITAWPQEKDGVIGYGILNAYGVQGWADAESFDRTCVPIGYVATLPPFAQQMIAEFEQTVDWADKLEAFMGGEAYAAMPEPDRELLKEQYDILLMLIGVLGARQDRFIESANGQSDDE